jgi:hypothetical protein
MREATKFDEFGFRRFQSQAESPQPLGKCFLNTKSIRTILETQHEVVDISHHASLAPESGLDHSLEPQIEHIVEIYITQQYADHAPYTKGNFDRLRLRSRRFVVELKESECCDEW